MRRTAAITTLVLAILAGGSIALVGGFFNGLNCVDGDGGSPYVAEDSAQKAVCNATGDGWLLFIAMAALVIVVATYASTALIAWGRGAKRALLAFRLAAPVVAAPLVLFSAANTPSDKSPPEKRDAVDRWRDDGEQGEAPYDCESY